MVPSFPPNPTKADPAAATNSPQSAPARAIVPVLGIRSGRAIPANDAQKTTAAIPSPAVGSAGQTRPPTRPTSAEACTGPWPSRTELT